MKESARRKEFYLKVGQIPDEGLGATASWPPASRRGTKRQTSRLEKMNQKGAKREFAKRKIACHGGVLDRSLHSGDEKIKGGKKHSRGEREPSIYLVTAQKERILHERERGWRGKIAKEGGQNLQNCSKV